MTPSYHDRVDALEVLTGDRQADLAVTNGRIVDVWSGEIRDGGVAVIGETIIAAGPIDDFIGPDTELIDAEGAFLTPGLIETHLHVYESNLNPTELARILLPHGTTALPEAMYGAGTLVVDTSTLPIELKLRAREALSEKGAVLLDCPLSGTGDQARTGDVVVFSSGKAEDVARCAPVLEAFSRSHHYVGEFGAGSKMKFVANLLVAIHNVAAAEAMMLARACGLDLDQTLEVIADSAATSRMWEVRGSKMVEDEYEPGIRLNLFEKDLRIISSFARDNGAPAPLLAASVELYEQALKAGDGALDSAVVFRRYLQMSDDGS